MTAAQFAVWRQRAGLTLREVAEGLGVTEGGVGHWEKGTRPISEQIARHLRLWAKAEKLPAP